MSSTAGRAASVLRDGVVYSGSAIVNGVNAITPHFAGAVDILVVRQPDGSLRSTPFYVRFGKYSSLRAKDRAVRIFINGSDTSLEMHLGSYGQAYFITESLEVCNVSDQEAGVDYGGMISSPSGYSSNDEEEDAPYANTQMLEAVRTEVSALHKKEAKITSADPVAECSSWKRIEDTSLPVSPFRFRKNDSALKRKATERSFSDNEDALNENDEESKRAPHHGLQRVVVEEKITSSLLSVRSCPSFKTAMEGDLNLDEGPHGDGHSHQTPEDAVTQDAEYFSPAGSLENSSNQNNDALVCPDPESHFTSAFSHGAAERGEMGDLENVSQSLVGLNDGYDGDTETAKFAKESNLSPFPVADSLSASILRGLEISLCGHLLKRDMPSAAAQSIFEAHRVLREDFQEKGIQIAQDSRLICRVDGVLYPWSMVVPMVLGMLAFDGRWDHMLQARHSLGTSDSYAKETASDERPSSGWSLWPFRGRSAKTTAEEQPGETESTDQRRMTRKKVLSPTPEQLASLNLEDGQNVISYRLGDNVQQEAYIYVISWSSRLVISDIDGTVTRSDILGHLLPPIGVDWTHSGVAHLFSNIKANGYEIMFLSSRAIAQANITRDFLHRLEQEGVKMPVGPVIISPHGLLPSLYREMILRRPHDFKIGCLQDVRKLFPDQWNPFYAGFGNRETDVISYEESGVPPSRIFTINSRGLIIRGTSTSIQTSTWSSLQGINELVNEVFPFYNEGLGAELQREEYNEFQHWRICDLFAFADDPELADLMSFQSAHSLSFSARGHSGPSLND